ncbi:MAG: hypothetical protein C4305_04010 [Thermoleophilia bacterium]
MATVVTAAVSATSAALGQKLETGQIDLVLLDRASAAEEVFELASWATTVPLAVAGDAGLLVQLVPNSFVVRLTRALAEADAQALEGGGERDERLPAGSLRALTVRVSAELGRAQLAIGRAVALPGRVIELDRGVDDPIDVLVNGRPFARGRLLVSEGEWAVQIEELEPPSPMLAGGSPA